MNIVGLESSSTNRLHHESRAKHIGSNRIGRSLINYSVLAMSGECHVWVPHPMSNALLCNMIQSHTVQHHTTCTPIPRPAPTLNTCIYIYVYSYIYIYIYIYMSVYIYNMYTERERERCIGMHVCMYVYVCVYIYIYIERERDVAHLYYTTCMLYTNADINMYTTEYQHQCRGF